ncbi:MAG: Ig-like domain-containing protein [Bacteroidetes bacterium]|nr:Ig-like domain-containing protein [Bacteroidota bacterium]
MSFRAAILFIITIVAWGCAQQGSPTGGPRDEDPPMVMESEPPNYSTRFEAKKIHIIFDEYIVLDNVNQELVVSPPMEEKPRVKLKGKALVIEFEEELKDSTTYTFNFGGAIKDLHEGNKLLNFEYVFSTGDVLDSLSVRGTLKYAEDLTIPEDPITIMLYEDLRDSVPLTDIPLYVGRSNDSGVFSVNNLKADTFKVFALKDGNYNLLFDLPTEEIAFLDSSLIVDAEFIRSIVETGEAGSPADSADLNAAPQFVVVDNIDELNDSTSFEADTSGMVQDTLFPEPDYNSIYIDLVLFAEEVETQYITEEQREDPRKILFAFARPLTDSFSYRFLTAGSSGSIEYLEVFSAKRDSLTLWLRDSTDFRNDSLALELNYTVKDTTNLFVTQTDTLLMTYREKKSKKKKGEVPEEEKLTISTLRVNGELDLNTNLKLNFNVPLEGFRDSLVHLWQIPDSVEVPLPFHTRADTLVPTIAWIDADWESYSNYHLQLLPGALYSIYELAHDTLDLAFRTRDIEYYGQILLTLEKVSNPVIIQLTSKDQVMRQQIVYKSGLYTFSYLSPKDYGFKIIHDLNDNGKWDTGNYLKKQQPEPVEILPRTITVRSNWDHDVLIVLEK